MSRDPVDMAANETLRADSSDRPKKILIFIDQFEQWLVTRYADVQFDDASGDSPHGIPGFELIQSLGHCDGIALQCVFLLRNDFFHSIVPFMNELNTRIVENENAMLIRPFDRRHAVNVVTEMGYVAGDLSEKQGITAAQRSFIQRAVDELAEQGEIYPVRLAVLLELIHGRPWTDRTLDEMGGADGIGVEFLDRSVGRGASDARRQYTRAAQSVLQTMLPQSGNIRGTVILEDHLRNVAGYAHKPVEFDGLMGLLRGELRLLTQIEFSVDQKHLDDPSSALHDGTWDLTQDDDTVRKSAGVATIDPLGDTHNEHSRKTQNGVSDDEMPDAGNATETDATNASPTSRSMIGYQLSHDFLVPSIRRWLKRELQADLTGQQMLALQERASQWIVNRETRHLPSLVQFALFVLFTPRNSWTGPQSKMMSVAGWRFGLRAAVLGTLLSVTLIAGMAVYNSQQRAQRTRDVQQQISSLCGADPGMAESLYRRIEQSPDIAHPIAQAIIDDATQSDQARLRCALLMPDQNTEVIVNLATNKQCGPDNLLMMVNRLGSAPQEPINAICDRLTQQLNSQLTQRDSSFRAAALLANLGPGSGINHTAVLYDQAPRCSECLLEQRSVTMRDWLKLFHPLRSEMLNATGDFKRNWQPRAAAAYVEMLLAYHPNSDQALSQFLVQSDGVLFAAIMDHLLLEPQAALQAINASGRQSDLPDADDESTSIRREETVRLALAKWLLGDDSAAAKIAQRPFAGEYALMVESIQPSTVRPFTLTQLLQRAEGHVALQTVLLLAKSGYPEDAMVPDATT
ncbi:MAG: hypothetical protein AAFP90_15040, partial [Planctomycetota bacterium]